MKGRGNMFRRLRRWARRGGRSGRWPARGRQLAAVGAAVPAAAGVPADDGVHDARHARWTGWSHARRTRPYGRVHRRGPRSAPQERSPAPLRPWPLLARNRAALVPAAVRRCAASQSARSHLAPSHLAPSHLRTTHHAPRTSHLRTFAPSHLAPRTFAPSHPLRFSPRGTPSASGFATDGAASATLWPRFDGCARA